jgi:hypothetical protein
MPIDVPGFLKANAQRGLDYNREGKGGEGLTDKTLDEAREFANGFTTESKVRRMPAWFARHKPDLEAPANKPGNDDFPGAGAVAWLIWGGSVSGDTMDAADWAQKLVDKWDKEAQAFDSGCTDKMSQEFLTPEAQLETQLKAVASLQVEKAELQADYEALASEKLSQAAEVQAKVEEATAKAVTLEAAVASLQAEKAELVKQLEAALANQITASKEAAKVVASLGVKPLAISPGDEVQAVDPVAIRTEFLKMKPGLEKQAFFKQHFAILTATK